jgi:TonB family protein
MQCVQLEGKESGFRGNYPRLNTGQRLSDMPKLAIHSPKHRAMSRLFNQLAFQLAGLLIMYLLSSSVLATPEEQYLADVAALNADVEEIAASKGPFSIGLFEPLMQLAEIHLDFDANEEALDSLHRAMNVSHRNEGVYTPKQLRIIELITQINLDDGDYRGANKQKKFGFFVITHHLDEDDPALIDAYAELATWYMQSGQTHRARRLLRDGVELTENLEANSLPLKILDNKARHLSGVCCNPKVLREAVETDAAGMDADTLAQGYLEIADSLLMGRKWNKAREYIAKAWEVSPLSTNVDPRPIAARRSLNRTFRQQQTETFRVNKRPLDGRNRLQRMTPNEELENLAKEPLWFILDARHNHQGFILPDSHETSRGNSETQELVGYPLLFSEEQLDNILSYRVQKKKGELVVNLTFDVTDKGTLENIQVTDSNAPRKLDRLLVEALKKVYYRPAINDGLPVPTNNVKFRQTFRTASHDTHRNGQP